jgi:hypothetical protein
LGSVITPSCQIKAWAQLKLESKVLPTTWPRLLMPLAMAAKSPGRGFRLVSVPFCQSWPSTSGTTRRCENLRGIESRIGSRLHISLLSDNRARGVPPSRRLRDITDLTFQTSKPSGGLTAFWDNRRADRTAVSPTFHTIGARGYEIRERQLPKVRRMNCD